MQNMASRAGRKIKEGKIKGVSSTGADNDPPAFVAALSNTSLTADEKVSRASRFNLPGYRPARLASGAAAQVPDLRHRGRRWAANHIDQ